MELTQTIQINQHNLNNKRIQNLKIKKTISKSLLLLEKQSKVKVLVGLKVVRGYHTMSTVSKKI